MTRIFVFGANLAGRHGKGAALYALRYYGAVYGNGRGLQGNSYAIPTKDAKLNILSLPEIKKEVEKFIKFAELNQNLTFEVTRIGCGLAGYKDIQIAPMFCDAPENCILASVWKRIIYNLRKE
jgi:hypothetical protein